MTEDICSVAYRSEQGYLPPSEISKIQHISEVCAYHNLFQLNHICNVNNVILDLILSHTLMPITQPDADEYLLAADSNHPPLQYQMNLLHCSGNSEIHGNGYYYDFKSANFIDINNYLGSIPWEDLLSGGTVDEMTNMLYDILYKTFDIFVPVKKIASRRFPKWFTQDLKALTIQRKIAHKKYKKTRLPTDYQIFSDLRSQCNRVARDSFQGYLRDTETALKYNPKKFWSYTNSLQNTNKLPSNFHLNNKSTPIGPQAAELFAEHFSSVYTNQNLHFSDHPSLSPYTLFVLNIPISDIFTELKNINPHKGPGPDNIHPLILKNCCFVLSKPLHIIFNTSLWAGVFPEFWKSSYVVPIHKSGDSSNVKNYRPICILNAIPKVFENIVTKFLTSCLGAEIVPEQMGFKKNSSTEINLLTYHDILANALEGGEEVHSIYTDFSKAFDRVNHGVLIKKLEKLGVGGSLLRWILSYLTGRTQTVHINNFTSSQILVSSGVPQGSHLGPLLFNLFINDIISCFNHCLYLLFADDLKLFLKIATLDDCLSLQKDLDRLSLWCQTNGMELNVQKCKVIKFHKTRANTNFVYQINGNPLECVDQIRDLGVLFCSSLDFSSHIDTIISRALRMLGFIKRCTKQFVDINAIKTLYFAYVRTHLEYASSVWSPNYACHIHRLESVQRKFCRYLNYKFFTDREFHYSNACKELNLTSLSCRRKQRDLKLIHKIVNSTVDSPYLLSKIDLHVPSRNTRTISTFHQQFHRTNYSSHSFIPRTLRLCNGLRDADFFGPYEPFVRFITGLSL